MFRFLRLSLAVFRIVVFVIDDDFPVMKRIREQSIWYPGFREFIRCHRCVGVHASWVVLLLDRFRLTRWVVDVLALAGVQVIVYNLWRRFRQ